MILDLKIENAAVGFMQNKKMDYLTAQTIVLDEANTGQPLLIFIAIGCSLDRYPDGEHPKQQYPSFMNDFTCNQICILIDPYLEMPPRILTDIKDKLDHVLVLPIQANFDFIKDKEFLQTFLDLCMNTNLQVKMVVQDYTGRDINLYYPVHHGPTLFKNVLFDFTYGDGNCFPDLSKGILMDESGDFIQPLYSTFKILAKNSCREILQREMKSRSYPVIHLFQRLYRIHRKLEEPRDWCTEEVVKRRLPRFCVIYNIRATDLYEQIRSILMSVVDDLSNITDSYLTEREQIGIVDSPGKELENMWKLAESIADSI